ncbi:MAG: insulinase family protein [Bryobacteraceae bacterium]|nr:insulinase family protein [Bryobacteraceae bacterium]
MKKLLLVVPLLLLACGRQASDRPRFVELPDSSPLVSFRLVFLTGAASDPPGKEGLAGLTASMLAEGGTRDRPYSEIVDAMFPMATSVSAQVDKEMTTFSAVTHRDNLDRFHALFRSMLLEPGWRPEDLTRLRDQNVNFLRVSLRGDNDEELGKEVLYNAIYASHPYGHNNAGTVRGLNAITMEDMKQFYAAHYTRANLIVGIGGGYPRDFPGRLRKDFEALPEGERSEVELPNPTPISGVRVRMVEKDTRSVAYSIGYPIDVKRGDPDYLPLLVMQSYFGQHRTSAGRLFTRMREERGLNYGDYAYIEYFPRGMFQLEPDPNLARRQQIFQIWIRPVEPETAQFALRLALFELDKLVKDGLTAEDLEHSRKFLTKYVNLLLRTKQAELGYAVDSVYYGIPDFATYVKEGLAKLTVEDVNRAIRTHLRTDRLQIVAVTPRAKSLADRLVGGRPSPISYNSPKPAEILGEDKIVAGWPIPIDSKALEIVPVEQVFE